MSEKQNTTTAAYVTETHRYWLRRTWDDDLAHIAWVMLNPSTADARVDDPTIRRCVGFSKGWGYGGIEVVNVYNLRATNPKALWGDVDRMGSWLHRDVAEYLMDQQVERAICAWGAHAKPGHAANLLSELERYGIATSCLGKNKGGSPKHPLYLAAKTPPQAWP